jgi:polygalacturonase
MSVNDVNERRRFIKKFTVGAAVTFPALAYAEESIAARQQSLPAKSTLFFNVADFGAVGDGRTLCTTGIQKAVDACAQAGGGRVIFPAGKFLTGPIFMKSNVHVEIPAGTTLLGSTDFDKVPSIAGRWEGIDRTVYASMFTGLDLDNISITGRGVIDGRGDAWWKAFEVVSEMRRKLGLMEREPENPPGSPLKWGRPRMINLYRCKNILISGLTVLNSPAWNIHPVLCDNIILDQLTIISPAESHNTDGIDPDSCRNMRISNCYISVGDDCITIKSGYKFQKSGQNIPSQNILVTNCVFARGHGGVGIGSETSGGVRDVTVSNCVCEGTDRGLRFKTARSRGNIVENFRAVNFVMRGVGDAISITMLYNASDPRTAQPVDDGTPTFRNFHLSNITVSDVKRAMLIEGLPEMPIQGLSISNFVANGVGSGITCSNVTGIVFDNIQVHAAQGPAMQISDVKGIEIYRLADRNPRKDQPSIRFERVNDGLIQSCTAAENAGTFLEIKGAEVRDVSLLTNRLTRAAKEVAFVDGASESAVVRRL